MSHTKGVQWFFCRCCGVALGEQFGNEDGFCLAHWANGRVDNVVDPTREDEVAAARALLGIER